MKTVVVVLLVCVVLQAVSATVDTEAVSDKVETQSEGEGEGEGAIQDNAGTEIASETLKGKSESESEAETSVESKSESESEVAVDGPKIRLDHCHKQCHKKQVIAIAEVLIGHLKKNERFLKAANAHHSALSDARTKRTPFHKEKRLHGELVTSIALGFDQDPQIAQIAATSSEDLNECLERCHHRHHHHHRRHHNRRHHRSHH